jgi:octaprenyl-diphosphate synthase
MPALAAVYELIAGELQQVCRIFDDELFSELPFLNDLCAQVRRYRGKMLRPALLLLTGKACGRTSADHLTLAAVLELVHMATLVHDDVLDEADVRRRSRTVNRMQGNEAAVLLGDYLISHAFHLCSSLDSQFASRTIAATTNTVCEGELQQVHHRGDLDLTEEQYFQIITRKTAALTAACCQLGAYCSGVSPQVRSAAERYGQSVGIAFQITDDVLDITGTEQEMGKTLGLDVEKQKLTLPLIHALANAEPAARREIRALIAAPHTNGDGQKARSRLRELLETTGSTAYALDTAREHVANATSALTALPPGEPRDALARLAAMILDREQ